MSAQQQSEIKGGNNIVVQMQGDDNTVTISQPHLSLIAWHRTRRRPEKVLDLLNPFIRAIPLIGPDSARTELESWLTSEKAISVRCVIGRGGSGKTRLAIELCEHGEKEHWDAGFVTQKEMIRFTSQPNLANWGWPKDTLVVVDYAAAQSHALREWLRELAHAASNTGKRLRILLLERHADPQLGWWRDLITPGTFSEEPMAALFDPQALPVALPVITEVGERREILTRVMEEASRLLAKPEVLKPPAQGENTEFDRSLADQTLLSTPLYLTMSAVTAVQEGIPTLLTHHSTEMAQRIASDELSRIGKLAVDRKLPPDLLRFIAVGVTLAGGYALEELIDCVGQERSALAYGQQDDHLLANAASDATGVQFDKLPPILPDLVGEAAILEQLEKLPREKRIQFTSRWFGRARGAVGATLVRTAQDYGTELELDSLHAIVKENHAEIQTLMDLAAVLPSYTLQLADFSVELSEVIVSGIKGGANKGSDEVKKKEQLMLALAVMAHRLSAVGRWDDALLRSQEAVEVAREAGSPNESKIQSLLAQLLNIHALNLRNVGRLEEALVQVQNAVAIVRRLDGAQPGIFRWQLANLLNTLSSRLEAVGRRIEALESARNSVALFRELIRHDVGFRGDMATSLGTLSNVLSDLGEREEAVALARESVQIRRELASTKPDAFLPDLALSLNNLGNRLREVAKLEEAGRAMQEAISIRRQLVRAHPSVYTPYLATSLQNVAAIFGSLDRKEDAHRAAVEAVELSRRWARERGTAGESVERLAVCLYTLACTLRALGRRDEVIRPAVESLNIYRGLNVRRPNVFRLNLASSLNLVADYFAAWSMFKDAVEADEEAIETLAPMFDSNPDACGDLMQGIAGKYARLLRELKREPRPDLIDVLERVASRYQAAQQITNSK